MSRRKQILVDLTPLLDVILIILFMFVARSQNAGGSNNLSSQQKKLEEAKQAYEKINRETNSIKALDKACKTITVTVKSDDKSEKRKLIIQKEKEDEEVVEFGSSDVTYAKNSLKTKLNEEYMKLEEDEKVILLIFQYDENNIYNADYNFVDEVLKKVQKGNDKIYISYYDTAGKKEDK